MEVNGVNFPWEIMIQILMLLPAESLLKMMAVCKDWYALIKYNTRFKLDHFKQSTLRGNETFLCGRYFFTRNDVDSVLKCLVGNSPNEFMNGKDIPICLDTTFQCEIVDSINGLVCFTGVFNFGNNIYLFNPFIRKFREVPTSPSSTVTSQINCLYIHLGFGFHTPSSDHKIVKVTYFIKPRDYTIEDVYEDIYYVTVEVYSLISNLWTTIINEDDSFTWMLNEYTTRTYIDNKVHWIGYKTGINKDDPPVIVSFDFMTETFRNFSLPHGYEEGEENKHKGHLLVVMNNLSFGAVCPNEDGEEYCTIWGMKNYGLEESWTEIFRIQVIDQTIHTNLSSIWKYAIVLEETSFNGDLFFFEFDGNNNGFNGYQRYQQSNDTKEYIVVRNTLFLLGDAPQNGIGIEEIAADQNLH